jgi:S-adenosylmethionine/arginine decarboxylase-like enzyme
LNDLPEKLKMKKLAEPEVYFAAGDPNTKDLGGWSGFVVIAESHISTVNYEIEKISLSW